MYRFDNEYLNFNLDFENIIGLFHQIKVIDIKQMFEGFQDLHSCQFMFLREN